MENKVYYGEYSLDYWIELILSKNVILPPYQRNFSWDEEQRKKLIISLKNKEFVPPVIIGSFTKNRARGNLLIDGQQRLTSILLSVLGFFPDRKSYRKYSENKVRKYMDENDDNLEGETDVINWSFTDLLKEDNLTISKIKENLEKEKYFKALNNDNEIDKTFLKNTFLGFSYLVPSNSEEGDQQRYYSSVFRNINRQGLILTGQESREALYYLDDKKKDFFKPDFIDLIEGDKSIDFIRYLSILSQYKKENSVHNLCNKYGGKKEKLEEYYEDYIKFIIEGRNNKADITFISYEELFGNDNDKPHLKIYKNMENVIRTSPISKKIFDSIIDCDMYYFGLFYLVIFENKSIDSNSWGTLMVRLDEQIRNYKAPWLDSQNNPTYEYSEPIYTNYHQKNPSALRYLRDRVEKSIAIYREFGL